MNTETIMLKPFFVWHNEGDKFQVSKENVAKLVDEGHREIRKFRQWLRRAASEPHVNLDTHTLGSNDNKSAELSHQFDNVLNLHLLLANTMQLHKTIPPEINDEFVTKCSTLFSAAIKLSLECNLTAPVPLTSIQESQVVEAVGKFCEKPGDPSTLKAENFGKVLKDLGDNPSTWDLECFRILCQNETHVHHISNIMLTS